MRKTLFAVCVVAGILWASAELRAQDIAVKTNALYWLTTTPNLGAEFAVGDRSTLSLEGGYNPWTLNKEENRI